MSTIVFIWPKNLTARNVVRNKPYGNNLVSFYSPNPVITDEKVEAEIDRKKECEDEFDYDVRHSLADVERRHDVEDARGQAQYHLKGIPQDAGDRGLKLDLGTQPNGQA